MTARRLEVAPERLSRWLAGFAERHGEVTVVVTPEAVVCTAADGSTAEVRVPFPPLPVDPADAYAGLPAHAARPRRLGILLVRRGGFAAAVADGPRTVASKVGKRHVQGRSAAGGWSQQRFARRRDQQAKEAAGAAADAAVKVLLPEVGNLDALVTGGDGPMLTAVLADPRLAPLRRLVSDRVLPVADPRRDVLEAAVAQARAVVVVIDEPAGAAPTRTG